MAPSIAAVVHCGCNSNNCTVNVCPDTNTTVILANAPFVCSACLNAPGNSYMTIYTNYTNSGVAEVFATGSMQWNWGLDDFGTHTYFGTSRVHSAAQQMTHNVLRTFSGKTNAPVIFVNADAGTSGNWPGIHGTNGYVIADTTDITSLPSYAQVTIQGRVSEVWTNQSTDTRALLRSESSTNRVAAAWTTTTNLTFDLAFNDTNTHQVALYCVDWLGTGTILERIEVFDYPDTSHPLDTRNFQLPSNGVHFIWNLSGHKTLRITKPDATIGNKAMVSAVFFDP